VKVISDQYCSKNCHWSTCARCKPPRQPRKPERVAYVNSPQGYAMQAVIDLLTEIRDLLSPAPR
jgi:hypothetical protein